MRSSSKSYTRSPLALGQVYVVAMLIFLQIEVANLNLAARISDVHMIKQFIIILLLFFPNINSTRPIVINTEQDTQVIQAYLVILMITKMEFFASTQIRAFHMLKINTQLNDHFIDTGYKSMLFSMTTNSKLSEFKIF